MHILMGQTAWTDVLEVGVDRQVSDAGTSEKKVRQSTVSPLWGGATPGPSLMNLSSLGELIDAISCVSFGFDRFNGFY
jgi:hypothetical protein